MSDVPVLLHDRDGYVAIITLNRPEKLNALNAELRDALLNKREDLERDEEVRAVVIHGAGDKAFVAGADISEFAARSPEEQREAVFGRRIYEGVADFKKPIIAAIHGFCIGGGCELALAGDVRVADQTARMSQAEIRIGLIPGGGGTQRLARLVGRGWTTIMSLTGDFVEAEDAHHIGLIDVLVEEGQHLDKALELAIESFIGVLIAGPRTGSKTANMNIPKQLPPIVPGIEGTVASVETLRPNASIAIEAGGKFNCWMENLINYNNIIERCNDGRPAIIGQKNRQYLAGWPDQEVLKRILSDVCLAQNVSITRLPDCVRVRDTLKHRFWFNYSETESIVGGIKLPPSGVIWESL